MAITTSTSITEIVNSQVINPLILAYAVDFVIAAQFNHVLDLRELKTITGAFPKWELDTAQKPGNETTSLTNNDLTLSEVTIAAVEVGIRRDISDVATESNVLGAALFDHIIRDAALLLAVSLDNDTVALYAGFSTVVGTTGDDLTAAILGEGIAKLRQNKMRGRAVMILDDEQSANLQANQLGLSATTVGSFMNINADNSDYCGTMFGADVFSTGACDVHGGGTDVAGAIYIDGNASPSAAAIGQVMARGIKTETDRDISARTTIFTASANWGVGEISDASGIAVITDA